MPAGEKHRPSAQRFTVRLACSHLNVFWSSYPDFGATVWCGGCQGYRTAALYYFSGASSALNCAAEAGWAPRLHCTARPGHEGEHYDAPLGRFFAAPQGRLRSGTQGNCLRA